MSSNKSTGCRLQSDPSAVVEERRAILRGLTVGAATMFGGGALLTASSSAKAAGINSIYTVGEGGDFTTLSSAASTIMDASEAQQYQLILLPGIHTISAKVVIPDYVHLRGSERNASTLYIVGKWSHLEIGRTSTFSNFSVINDSAYDVQYCFRVRYPPAGSKKNILLFDGVDFNIDGSSGYCIRVRSPVTLHIRGCNVFTSGTGLSLEGRCYAFIYDTNIYLTGAATGTEKVCIDAADATRVFIYGGKYGTGYGAPEISNDPSADFIGFKVGNTNRVQVFNAWMIIRQDAVWATGLSYAVKMTDPNGWIRLSGGYYQAEMNNSGQTSAGIDVDNSVGATVEIYPDTRIRAAFTLGDTVGFTGATGVASLVAGEYHFRVGEGGIKKCDTFEGDITILLYDGLVSGEEFLFVRTIGSGMITIKSITGTLINGQSKVTVGLNPYDKLTVRRLDTEFIAY